MRQEPPRIILKDELPRSIVLDKCRPLHRSAFKPWLRSCTLSDDGACSTGKSRSMRCGDDCERGARFYHHLVQGAAGPTTRVTEHYDQIVQTRIMLSVSTPAIQSRFSTAAWHAGQRQSHRAIPDFDRVIKLRPDAMAYYNRGLSYRDLAITRERFRFPQAIRFDPKNAAISIDRGISTSPTQVTTKHSKISTQQSRSIQINAI
jgi:hypothetical protein